MPRRPSGTAPAAGHEHRHTTSERAAAETHGDAWSRARAHPRPRDDTLQHPSSVYQILKRHYARYTPEMVAAVCGVSVDDFDDLVARRSPRTAAASGPRRSSTPSAGPSTASACSTSARPRSCSCCSATWAVRAAASWRCAGTRASRDRPTSRRSTTSCRATSRCPSQGCTTPGTNLGAIGNKEQKGFWTNADTYAVNLLKAWWGNAATAENDLCFDYLPRLTGEHGTYHTMMAMLDGKVQGYFLLGQNPAVGSAHGRMQRLAMATSTGSSCATST